ncbi:NUDIX domain-containing protein [Pseudoalteromonas tunicata]|uniref:NUDIX hydrolase n=1 Tax=Pseudoalteromonas tunicata TaxID=314281 RepID=UPI00273E29AB|nr:NUDIX domain-containing protein [Pseudoalteromonas tunicata]MDP5213898.1 NUDIX domain-containing protein [Pseudoalteromonas tunicata]
MRLLKQTQHPDIINNTAETLLRNAARAIVLRGNDILLMYTHRYDDYSLPGGGVNQGESIIDALKRELHEETGAQQIEVMSEFGAYFELRPWNKAPFELVQMNSYCFVCNIADELHTPQFEQHEINNGMRPVWIDIHCAIKHNLHTLATSEKKGISIERETFLLQTIVAELIKK